MCDHRGSTAVIVGGAFAGLAAAGWLSEFFDQVLVLERDVVPTTEADALRLLEDLSKPETSIQVQQSSLCTTSEKSKGGPHRLLGLKGRLNIAQLVVVVTNKQTCCPTSYHALTMDCCGCQLP